MSFGYNRNKFIYSIHTQYLIILLTCKITVTVGLSGATLKQFPPPSFVDLGKLLCGENFYRLFSDLTKT